MDLGLGLHALARAAEPELGLQGLAVRVHQVQSERGLGLLGVGRELHEQPVECVELVRERGADALSQDLPPQLRALGPHGLHGAANTLAGDLEALLLAQPGGQVAERPALPRLRVAVAVHLRGEVDQVLRDGAGAVHRGRARRR